MSGSRGPVKCVILNHADPAPGGTSLALSRTDHDLTLRSLPVIDEEARVVGIVSRRDLMAAIAPEAAAMRRPG